MTIVGFNFTKINAERKKVVLGSVSITNNITIKGVTEGKLGLAGDRAAVRISFAYASDYQPNFATIAMEGDVLLLVNATQQQEILEHYKKTNALKQDIVEPVMNHILDRCNVQALLLSKDLNLPAPVRLPKVQVNTPAAPAKPEAKAKAAKKK